MLLILPPEGFVLVLPAGEKFKRRSCTIPHGDLQFGIDLSEVVYDFHVTIKEMERHIGDTGTLVLTDLTLVLLHQLVPTDLNDRSETKSERKTKFNEEVENWTREIKRRTCVGHRR